MAKATIRISPEVMKLGEKVQANLVSTVAPKAFRKIDPIIEDAMVRHLPDGDLPNPNDKDGTPSRLKQTEFVRNKFSGKMKRAVGGKTIRDSSGSARIIGVTNEAPQVNFDHGDKGKGEGRDHKYWWRPGHEKPNPPKLRKQVQDISKVVMMETADQIQSILLQEVKNAVNDGSIIK